MKELDAFIKEKDRALVKDVRRGDYGALVTMMGHLGQVREKTALYDNLFDPLKKKIELLKTYGQEVPDDVYERLQVINLKKKIHLNFSSLASFLRCYLKNGQILRNWLCKPNN